MGKDLDAMKALYTEIERQTNALSGAGYNAQSQAGIVRDLALAYRLVDGGPQPGTSVVEK